MDENKMEVLETVEKPMDEHQEASDWNVYDLPQEKTEDEMNFGAVVLVAAGIGLLAYGAKKAWDWHKTRKARKNAEAEVDEFEEIVEVETVEDAEEAEVEPVEEETVDSKPEESKKEKK